MKTNHQKIAPYLFISPFFILFLIFGAFPNLFSLFLSFNRWSGMGKMEFVGLKNFIYLIKRDDFFWKSLTNTFILLLIGSLLQHIIALPLAVMLDSKVLKGREFFRTAYFLPYITSTVSIAFLFGYLFDRNFGLFNYLLELIGLPGIKWFSEPSTVKPAIAILLNWRWIGRNTILYLAGLQSIPEELIESARVEGAGRYEIFFFILLPLLLPVIFFAVSLSIIFGMQLFDEALILTGGVGGNPGGVDNAGLTTLIYLYTVGFRWGKFGLGSAVSWLLFLIIISATVTFKKIIERIQH